MVHLVVEITAAKFGSPLLPGTVIAHFDWEDEAVYFVELASKLEAFRRYTLAVRRQGGGAGSMTVAQAA